MIQSGEVLDGIYRILQEIGHGGAGIVFLAEHLRLQKKVVVKKIKDNFVGQINSRVEVDILKQLHHAYLPQVYDFLEIGGSIYTVMEYIEGYDLQHYLDTNCRFSEEQLRKWLYELADVLEYLHTRKPPVLHSDIKPGNIMVTGNGDVCLIDFNISLDGENSKDILGVSADYAAPEQYEKACLVQQGKPGRIVLDARMDLYSLGATFYSLMTGYLPSPKPGQTPDIMHYNLAYSKGFVGIVSKMMEYKPGRRFQNASSVKKMLEDTARMDPVYRRYGNLQIVSCFAYAVCMAIGFMILLSGNWKLQEEEFTGLYNAFYLEMEDGDTGGAVLDATEILNRCDRYLSKNGEQKAEILAAAAGCYFAGEDYAQAAAYYEEAFRLVPEESSYEEKYVVALLYNGEEAKAAAAIQMAQGNGTLNGTELQFIQAHKAYVDGDYETALSLFSDLLRYYEGQKGEEWAAILQAEAGILEEEEEWVQAVDVLQKLEAYDGLAGTQRRLAGDAYQAAVMQEADGEAQAYFEIAISAYEEISAGGQAEYDDKKNLAYVQQQAGRYTDSIDTLKRLALENADDYEVPMLLCYNYLALAKAEGSYRNVRDDLLFYYEDCKKMYLASGRTDEKMEQLEEFMEQFNGQQ